jgi:Tol biopolymer transport system component
VLILGAGPAGATFSGNNGNVAFVSTCDGTIGQAVYSVNPNGNPPPTYNCVDGAAPTYTQSTAGSIDTEPYFSSTGTTLYFSSNRTSNPDGGPYQIYSVPYPATITGSEGSQVDGATQLTTPTGANDYAPTVSADGSEMTFVRCSSSTKCDLMLLSPVSPAGTLTDVTKTLTTLNLDGPTGNGEISRPEIDPANDSLVLYTDSNLNVHLFNLTNGDDLNLSQTTSVGSAGDQYPDWSPTGTQIVFSTSRATNPSATGSNFVWFFTLSSPVSTASTVTASTLWGTNDPGNEIEPVFAPDATTLVAFGAGANTTPLVWTQLGNGDNIVMYSPTAAIKKSDPLTTNKAINSEPAWQPTGASPVVPEAPYAILLPGGALLVLGLVLGLRHRRLARPAA